MIKIPRKKNPSSHLGRRAPRSALAERLTKWSGPILRLHVGKAQIEIGRQTTD